MTYLNQHARTTSPTKSDLMQQAGRLPALTGVYQAYIKDASDVQKNGRLRVWLPELGSDPDNQNGWIIVDYCSPFAGATNVDTISQGNTQAFTGTQTSYGMWMIPPDINNIVVVMFINGDQARGIWIGCLLNQFMNNMIPGMAASTENYQYPGKYVPVAEYNKWDPNVSQPDQSQKPYEQTKFQGVGNQGLITDQARGITTTSARREAPSSVFGIITPGPPITPLTQPPAGLSEDAVAAFNLTQQANIRRKGGSSFIMDDGTGSEYVQYTTKSGAQLKLDETNGFVYAINRDGTSWIEMDQEGNVMIFGATNVSVRAQQDINLRADRNINMEAGQDIYIKAAQDTINSTTTFTYNVNNIPVPSTIPYYQYVGQGNGIGGNVVIQGLNDIHATAQNAMYITVNEYDLSIQVNNDIQMTTIAGKQEFKSASNIDMQPAEAFNLNSTGEINIQTSSSFNLTVDEVISTQSVSFQINGNGATYTPETAIVTIDGMLNVNTNLNVSLDTQLNTGQGGSFVSSSTGASGPGPVPVPTVPPTPAGTAESATPAEVKPLLEKINILATWSDPISKFIRNAESLMTTLSQMPTYEPCPEHEQFTFPSITGYTPTQTDGQATYEGSGGAGNGQTTTPDTNTDPGANNVIIPPPNPLDSALVKDFNLAAYQCQIQIHEGVRYKSYLDTLNLPTGGIGHLLRQNELPDYTPVPVSITQDQVTAWFQSDAPTSIAGAMRLLGTDVWGDLTDIRKRACADLCYNMGETRLSKFTTFLANMKAGNYTLAGDSLRASKWFTQVGRRGPNIITMIVQNVDPNGCDVKFKQI
jgi:lysozyme